jgi:hypothetical protein
VTRLTDANRAIGLQCLCRQRFPTFPGRRAGAHSYIWITSRMVTSLPVNLNTMRVNGPGEEKLIQDLPPEVPNQLGCAKSMPDTRPGVASGRDQTSFWCYCHANDKKDGPVV